MRFRSPLMLLPALVLVGAGLAACSDDDDAATTAAPAAETTAAPAATTAAADTTAAAATTAAATTTAAPATTTPATTAASGAATSAAAGADTVTLADTSLGSVLADGEGRILYVFTNDSEGQSACSGQCASAWPPLVAEGEATAGDGIDGAQLSTLTRDDGTTQVAYFGHPLYYFASDAAPGDTNGQGVGGVWWVIDGAGTVIES